MPSFINPNYFLGLRITSSSILEKIGKLQTELISKNEVLSNYIEPPCKAHVTLSVMHLEDDELETCKSMLQEKFKPNLSEADRTLTFEGLGRFGNRVLFVKPHTGIESLQKMHEDLQNLLIESELKTEVGRDFHPHVTMFKTSRPKSGRKRNNETKEKLGLDDELLEEFKDLHFGEEIVEEIQLLSMTKPKAEDGYYHCEASFSLC